MVDFELDAQTDESKKPIGAGEVKGRVLLIDDELSILTTYSRVLRRAGFSVTAVSDGRSIRSELSSEEFDVVVTDITMPGTNGIDVLREVHAHDADLPVVLMTARGELTTALKAIEHGARRYLLKPVDPMLLTQAVEDSIVLGRVDAVKRDAYERYGAVANQRATARAQLTSRFDDALKTLHMDYQPIVRCSTRSVFAYEALVRTDEEGFRRPDEWFAAAAHLDRTHELGRTIRGSVAKTVKMAPAHICVFVNLHPRDFEDEELFSTNSPLSEVAARIVLEVTERASLDELGDLRARVATLRRIGYRIAIDDLGAGYSGLTAFVQLQPEVVKLDMSLVRDVDREPTKQKVVRTLTSLCSDLGMSVIAEGVESPAERTTMAGLGCDLMQGRLFAQPAAPFPEVRAF